MRILIFGARGQLGRDLVLRLQPEGEVLGMDLPELDISDEAAVAAVTSDFGPDIVINAAAHTDVEGAEDDEDGAYRINEWGAAIVARAAANRNIPVVYYSTDFVFDGSQRTPYEPDEPLNPLSVYGRSKASGERAVIRDSARHFIVRTAWLYGPGGNNFVEKILRAAQQRPELQVIEDEVGSPTHTWDLAEATAALIKTAVYGVYHAVNAGCCSRFEFACAILRLAAMSTPVRPCRSSRFPMKARRPAYSVLSNDRLERVTGYRMRSWEEALRHYLERRKSR